MFDQIKKATLIYFKTEYPFLIAVALLGISAEIYALARPDLAGVIELVATASVLTAGAVRFPFSHRKLTEAIENA